MKAREILRKYSNIERFCSDMSLDNGDSIGNYAKWFGAETEKTLQWIDREFGRLNDEQMTDFTMGEDEAIESAYAVFSPAFRVFIRNLIDERF